MVMKECTSSQNVSPKGNSRAINYCHANAKYTPGPKSISNVYIHSKLQSNDNVDCTIGHAIPISAGGKLHELCKLYIQPQQCLHTLHPVFSLDVFNCLEVGYTSVCCLQVAHSTAMQSCPKTKFHQKKNGSGDFQQENWGQLTWSLIVGIIATLHFSNYVMIHKSFKKMTMLLE